MKERHKTVGSNTYEKIKRDIVFGDLKPGSKLKLEGLKNSYDASVSTLRETLNRLASEGFVSAEEQRGFFVASVSKEDFIEVANLRVLLECHALQASIENGDAEWEGSIVAAHHKLKLLEEHMQTGDQSEKERWKRYDWEFHEALIQSCNSKNLLALHSIIYDKYLRYQMLVMTYRGLDAAEEHKQMLDAALARDSQRAQAILKTHVCLGLEHAMPAL